MHFSESKWVNRSIGNGCSTKKEFVTYIEAFSTLAKLPKMAMIEVHESIIVNNDIDMFTSITASGIFEQIESCLE